MSEATTTSARQQIDTIVSKDVAAICSIYPSVGAAIYDEPRDRLTQRITSSILKLLGVADGDTNGIQRLKDCTTAAAIARESTYTLRDVANSTGYSKVEGRARDVIAKHPGIFGGEEPKPDTES